MAEKKAATKKAAPKKKLISADVKILLNDAKDAYFNDSENTEWIGFIDALEKAFKICVDKKLKK